MLFRSELLLFLGEVDARRLYLDDACASMFVYCTQRLGLSEACAYHRIGAARAARRFPAILEEIREGRLHASGVTLLASQLTRENHREWLAEARGKSKRQIEGLIADRRPKPEVPATIRRLPNRRIERPDASALKVLEPPSQGRNVPTPPALRPEPLGEERFKVQFTADRTLYAKLQEAQSLLSHQVPNGALEQIFDRALGLLIDEVKRQRFAATKQPRAPRKSKNAASRHIPAELRRQVYERDHGQCTFVSPKGQRCATCERLEFHHREPWARRRDHSLQNLTLLCRAHNQHAADRDFGRTKMEQHRRARAVALPGESPPNQPSIESPRGSAPKGADPGESPELPTTRSFFD